MLGYARRLPEQAVGSEAALTQLTYLPAAGDLARLALGREAALLQSSLLRLGLEEVEAPAGRAILGRRRAVPGVSVGRREGQGKD